MYLVVQVYRFQLVTSGIAMGIEVLFKYKGYKSVINAAHRNQICGQVECHLVLSKATVNPKVICTASVCSADLLSGSSSGFNLFFLQRWSPEWDTYINVEELNEIDNCDWLTVTRELSKMPMNND